MEMNKKYARTTQGQLRWYIAFCKEHPELLQGKNCPSAPSRIGDFWKEIATNLNAMVGPSRTPDAWRESLRNWRKQLRSRARKVVSERKRTGGGQNPVAELTDFEQQALETFGIAAVEGHSNSRLGFQSANNAENISPAQEEEMHEFADVDGIFNSESAEFCVVASNSPSRTLLGPTTAGSAAPNTPSSSSAPSCSATPSASSPSLYSQQKARRNKKYVRDEILEIVQQDISERRAEQSRLAQSLDSIGSGLTSLAGAIHEMVAWQTQRRN